MRIRATRPARLVPILAAVLVLAAPAARAEDVEQAKQYFEAGKQLYESGQFQAAATAFEQAYELAPRPPILFSLAQAHRQQFALDGDLRKARRALDLYREYAGQVKRGGRRSDAVQHIATLQDRIARLEEEARRTGRSPTNTGPSVSPTATQLMVSSRTPGARASIGEGELGEVPVIADVPAGQHKIHVEAEGHFPEDLEGTAVEGRLIVVDVNLKARPALIALRAPSGASVSIDGRPVDRAALARPIEVPAGRHFVAVTARGHHPFTREVNLRRGEQTKLDARLARTRQRVLSYVLLAGAGALAISGGATAGVALIAEGDAEDIHARLDRGENITEGDVTAYNSLLGKRDDYRRASAYLLGGAVAVGVTGLLLHLVDSPRVEASPGATGGSITPVVTPDGAGISYGGSF